MNCANTTKMDSFILKEYYQSDRPTPPFYRHSQTDLTEWDEQQHNEHGRHNGHGHSSHHHHGGHSNNNNYQQQNQSNGSASQLNRRSGPPEREPPQGGNGFNQSYGRNGSTVNSNGKDRQQSQDDWEDGDRLRRDSR